MANKDLLQPFINADKNREETFMIEASGFLYNKAAHVVIGMLMNYDRYKEDYPHISIFKGLTALQIFNATKLFSPLDVLNQLSKNPINIESSSEEELEKAVMLYRDTMFELEEINTMEYMIMPIFAYSLAQIVKEHCCRKIYITNKQRFTEWEIAYIHNLFAQKLDKIELEVGDPFDLFMQHGDELTTIFLNDIYMLHRIVEEVKNENIDKEKINKQLFCLRVTNDIVKENAEMKILEYNCSALFKEYASHNVHASVIPLMSINDTDNNKIVSTK